MHQPASCTKKNVDHHHQHDMVMVQTELASHGPALGEATRNKKTELEGILVPKENGNLSQGNDIITPCLPPEMWEQVFTNIKDPKDWFNCYYTCKSFQGIMEKDKVATLLPSVIRIMSDHQKRYYTFNAMSNGNNGSEQSMKNVELTPDDIRTCRLVCKSWRTAINNHVSNHPSIQDLLMQRGANEINYTELFSSALPIVLDMKNSLEKVIGILNYLDTTQPKYNLLSSRHLVLKGFKSFAEHGESGKLLFSALLEKVGSSVWHFAVDNEADEFHGRLDLRRWWNNVNHCLSFLPNLRSLVIIQANWTADVQEPRILQVRHFPDLRVLQVYASQRVYTSILKTNKHIEKLTLAACGNEYECVPSSNFFKYSKLSKLKEFSIGISLRNRLIS